MASGPDLRLILRRMAFGAGPALFEDFELSVPTGQVLALTGPSGLGKTTLLRIMAGVEIGFDGVAKVGGVPADKAAVPGFVFQDARLLPWLTARQNLRAVRPDMTTAQVDDALAAVGLAGFADHFPREMSGGMQRRLGLARALAVGPSLLLLDEPFASLDSVLALEMQTLLQGFLKQRRPTVILVTHDATEAARLAHRVVILGGRPVRTISDLTLCPSDAPVVRRSPGQIAAIAGQIAQSVQLS